MPSPRLARSLLDPSPSPPKTTLGFENPPSSSAKTTTTLSMAGEATEIEVRALDGTATRVSVFPGSTIGDLKSRLRETFVPAGDCQSFHIFLKGDKLNEADMVSSFQLSCGEFMVLIPFAKRVHLGKVKGFASDAGIGRSETSSADVEAGFSESTWLDIKQDLLHLSDMPPGPSEPSTSGSVPPLGASGNGRSPPDCYPNKKRRKKESVSRKILVDMLNSDDIDALCLMTHQNFCQVLESLNCLSDCYMSGCLMSQEISRHSKDTDRCVCPVWLRRLMKSFVFLNVLYGLLQMQNRCLTWECLLEEIISSESIGMEDIDVSDVEYLLLLCPTVVKLVEQENDESKCKDAIIIFKVSKEVGMSRQNINCKTGKKLLSKMSIASAAEKREFTFKSDIRKSIRHFTEKAVPVDYGNSHPTLNDLISMKQDVLEGIKINSKAASIPFTSRCCDSNFLQPKEMVDHLRKRFGNQGQIVHVECIEAKTASYAKFPCDISKSTQSALEGMGISTLYSHQAEAIQALLSGKNVVIATSTSSGKSLCYNLPVIEQMSQNSSSCVLYMFPTKALAQDQLRSLAEITRRLNVTFNSGIYDGDTSTEQRTYLRDNARLLITNPDMLHMSILPYHGQFQRFLSNLRFIVIDEAHMYTGAFGCHTALILRRLRRICSHVYGIKPSFIFSTATSANPREHAMELVNLRDIDLIQKDGSPSGPKFFVLWNPPPYQTKKQTMRNDNKSRDGAVIRRSSPILETSLLFAEMVQHGLRCIAFCKTRKLCEFVLCYTREILHQTAPDIVDSISSYRSGYTIEDRRRIETELFGGKLRGVAATNALELGIDVGHIDATLHLGFPGSIASLWQQAGRSGRRARPSLAVYIAFEGPLDQYFMKFPQKLFTSRIDYCQIDAHNQQVLEQHLACAALEHPLSLDYDEKYFGSSLQSAVLNLKRKGCLCNNPSGFSVADLFNYSGPEKSPSRAVSIRAIETDKYKVVNMLNGEVIEEIEESRAFFQVYEGAIYMHQGFTYLVKKLDLSDKIAFCQKTDLKYYTKTRDYTDIHVIGGDLAYPPLDESKVQDLRTRAQVSKCMVTTCWFGFYRIWRGSNKTFDRVDLSLPTFSYETEAVWIRIPQSIKVAVENLTLSFRAGQHAASHALLNVVPLYIMCNSSDLSTECANPHESRDIPERILLYDQRPGGIGLSRQVLYLFNELLTAAFELVNACSCSSSAGCPNCIQALSCNEYNEVLDKKAALMILKGSMFANQT